MQSVLPNAFLPRVSPARGAVLSCFWQELLHTAPTLEAGARMLAHLATTDRAVIGQWTEHPDKQVSWWADALLRQIQAWLEEVNLLAPLAALPPAPHSLRQIVAAHETAVLSQLYAALERINTNGTLRDIAQLELNWRRFSKALCPWQPSIAIGWLSFNNASARLAIVRQREWPPTKNWPATCLELSDAEFGFLFDESRKLLAIGYNVAEHRLDASFYDLLASEARLASFVAIAQGQLRQEHWFALGRLLTGSDGSSDAPDLERIDVRISDAAAGHAELRRHAARSKRARGPSRGKSPTAPAGRFPGGCPSRDTISRMFI